MVTVHTRSGSVYQLDEAERRVRKLSAGPASNTKRCTGEWREYTSAVFALGEPLQVFWGFGRDEVSDELGTPPGDFAMMTVTSPVTRVEV